MTKFFKPFKPFKPLEKIIIPGWQGKIFHYDSLPSTNTFLSEGLRSGNFNDYDGVWANWQSAGRGRWKRTWIAPNSKAEEGRSLTFSLAIPLNIDRKDTASLLQVAAWTWVILMREFGASIQLKWPNDILAQGKKLAGFLAEVLIHNKEIILLGMGINLVFSPTFLKHLETTTGRKITSLDHHLPSLPLLEQEEETLLNPRTALVKFMKKFQPFLELWQMQGFAPFAETWRKESDLLGRRIVLNDGRKREVWVEDIEEDGRLAVRDGKKREIVSLGEIMDMDHEGY